MASWLVTLKDENGKRLYKCSDCKAIFKEEDVDCEEFFVVCPNCGEKITGAAVDHEFSEMKKQADEIKKIADKYKKTQSIPGIYERHMTDILDYLQAKFPQLGKDELMEAVGYISSRSMVMVQDTLIERDREWKKIIDDLNKNHEIILKMTLKAAGVKVEV